MRIFFAALILLLASCRNKTAVPEGIIPVAKMTDLLWDVLMADELVTQRYRTANEAVRLDTSVVLYQQIAAAHGTTQQQFKKSLRFYQSRPDLLQIIFDSLQQRSTKPAVAFSDASDDTVNREKDSLSRKLFQKPIVPPLRRP